MIMSGLNSSEEKMRTKWVEKVELYNSMIYDVDMLREGNDVSVF
mgnify:CR=1 FL=1